MTDRAEEEIVRGQRAEAILTNPVWIEAWDGMRADLMQTWLATNFYQAAEREDVYRMVRLLDAVRDRITGAMESGKIAQHNLALREAARQVNGIPG